MKTGIRPAWAAVGATLSLCSSASLAAELEEVVVTAQKRAEKAQDVPISISAFSAKALQERAIGDVSQLSNSAPNVSLDAGTPFSGSSSVISAYIRGIGQNDFAFNLDPGVGVYLDGVYLARSVGGNQDLLDVGRVEILKGPQGTLFGRNTIGGAISIVTRDPGNEFKIGATATTGSYERMQFGGTVDIPFSDSLKSSVTVSMKSRQGYMKRLPFNTLSPDGTAYAFNSPTDYKASAHEMGGTREGGDESWSARVKLKWDNGGNSQFTFASDFTSVDQEQLASKLLSTVQTGTFTSFYNTCIANTPAQLALIPAPISFVNLCSTRGTPVPQPAAWQPATSGAGANLVLGSLAGVNVDSNPYNNRLPYDNRFVTNNIDTTYANGNNLSKLQNWGASGTYEYDLNDSMVLKSITAYRQLHWTTATDLDGSPLNMLNVSFDMHQHQFSEELQLNGKMLNDTLKFVVGLYYFKESGDLHDFVTFGEGFLQIDGPNNLSTQNYAGFAQVDWRPTDLLGFTFGGRYTKEKKEFEGFQADLNGLNYKLSNFAGGTCVPSDQTLAASYYNCRAALGFPDPNYPLRYYVPGTQKKEFSNFSPKVGAQLHPTDNLMAYASWSKGYKTGGWTTRLSNPLPTAPGFGEEKAETIEAGLKSEFLNRRLQMNLSVYKTKYNGIQLNFQEGISPTIRNAGDADIKGAELEVNAAITAGFSVSASAGYTHAEYTSVLSNAVVAPDQFHQGVYVGAELPKTPKTKFNISPRYEFPLAGKGSVVLIADATHTAKMRNDTEGSLLLNRRATNVYNAGITYKAEDDKWDVTLGGTNLSDERYLTTGQAQLAGGQIYGTYNRPREWYLTLQFRQ